MDRRALAIVTVPLTRRRVIVDSSADDEESDGHQRIASRDASEAPELLEALGAGAQDESRRPHRSPTCIPMNGSPPSPIGCPVRSSLARLDNTLARSHKAHRRVTACRCGYVTPHHLHASCTEESPVKVLGSESVEGRGVAVK